MEEKDAVRKLLESPGWQLIDAWLTNQEERVTNAIKKDLIKLKWSEKDKWFPYYSGQISVIQSLRQYLEGEKNKEERKENIQRFIEKQKSLLNRT